MEKLTRRGLLKDLAALAAWQVARRYVAPVGVGIGSAAVGFESARASQRNAPPKRELTRNLELQLQEIYQTVDFSMDDDGSTLSLLALPDGTQHLYQGVFDDVNMKLDLLDKGKIPFPARVACVHPTNKDRIAAGGGTDDTGMVYYTQDDGSWRSVSHNLGRIIGIRHDPVDNFIYFSQGKRNSQNQIVIGKLNRADGTIVDLPVVPTDGSFNGTSMIYKFLSLSPDKIAYALASGDFGYTKLKFYPDHVDATLLNQQEWYNDNIVSLTDHSDIHTLTFNAFEKQGQRTTIGHENINDQQTYNLIPSLDLYPANVGLYFSTATVDFQAGERYFGVTTVGWDDQGPIYTPCIEKVPDPNTFNGRQLIVPNGDYPSRGIVRNLKYLQKGGKDILIANFDSLICFSQIPSGVNVSSVDSWKKASVFTQNILPISTPTNSPEATTSPTPTISPSPIPTSRPDMTPTLSPSPTRKPDATVTPTSTPTTRPYTLRFPFISR